MESGESVSVLPITGCLIVIDHFADNLDVILTGFARPLSYRTYVIVYAE